MKTKTRFWVVVALVGFIAVVLLGIAVAPPPKARAQRIRSVNNLASTFPKSFVLTNFVITKDGTNPPTPAR